MSRCMRVGAAAALLVAGSAQAGQLVCKDRIIGIGTSAAELLAACGAPVSKQAESATVRDAGARGAGDVHQSTVETWRYERHSRPLTTVVTLRDGKVLEIRNLTPKK
jgi:hypothetical protein